MKDMFLIKVQVYSQIPGKTVSYPVKKYTDLDRPEMKFPDPTWPENIFKNVPQPRTGFGRVRFGPGKFGVSGCPAGF